MDEATRKELDKTKIILNSLPKFDSIVKESFKIPEITFPAIPKVGVYRPFIK